MAQSMVRKTKVSLKDSNKLRHVRIFLASRHTQNCIIDVEDMHIIHKALFRYKGESILLTPRSKINGDFRLCADISPGASF